MKIFREKINLLFVGSLIVILYMGLVARQYMAHYVSLSRWVTHTNQVLLNLGDLETGVAALRSNKFEFLLLEKPYRPDQFFQESGRLSEIVNDLKQLVYDNPEQLARAEQLSPLVKELTENYKKLINSHQKSRADETVDIVSGKEKALTGKILSLILAMQAEENELLKKRMLQSSKTASQTQKAIFYRSFIIAAVFFTFVIIVNSQLRGRKFDAKRIQLLNASLSERVRELDYTNNELESFSYSVSHDLRAPIRGITGFSQTILEDYPDLPAGVKELLSRIMASSQRMAELIDGLLKLSRYSRRELAINVINMSTLARSVFDELKPSDSVVKFECPEGLICNGDPVLLRIVFENLISNAIKFSKKVGFPEVSFGMEKTETGSTYFIKDNGAGFEMKYADKLFGAFQRLHGQKDFEGIGIGLATVQRIIHRHGGDIWATSEVNNGAIFYFTLKGFA